MKKYRLLILLSVLVLTAVVLFWAQPWMESAAKPLANQPNCEKIRQCLNVDVAWPPGMQNCPITLAPHTVRKLGKDGKWGYSIDVCSKDTIIEPKFDIAERFGNNGLAKVRQDGKWIYVNLRGEQLGSLTFDEAGDFDFSMAPVKLKDKWGYYDAQGQIVGSIEFDAVSGSWRDERSAVQLNRKWGYINPQGKTVIKPSFDRVVEFKDGLAKVESNRKWGVVNTDGDVVIPPTFDAIFSTSDPRLLLVALGRKYGYVDSKGQEIIPPRLSKPVRMRYAEGGYLVYLATPAILSDSKAVIAADAAKLTLNAWFPLDSPAEKLRFDENGKAQFWRNGDWFYIAADGRLFK